MLSFLPLVFGPTGRKIAAAVLLRQTATYRSQR
jgi:hypothetical protein